ncbi:aminoglycoside phosphotransferase family protein [Catenuloplanes japonicus]|uniref:aminoglycoside phosphotransferase family protein n=1 Tax=Catenuloplanes japonicus TaxID=33876 RepID=UPI000A90CDE6|nr:aminoglycoside phosphotransferase family protein [Catenuloplanes japonicus]
MTGDQVLQDGPHRRVVRVGDTVRRPMLAWSGAIHELLRHLEAVGFPASPRVLGIDDQGREVLTYLDGDSGPDGWDRVVDERGLAAMARLLRDYHDAVRDFRPSARWASGADRVGTDQIVCHGDFGPWNLVWRGPEPVGILDWDYAGPGTHRRDVAYALEYVAPFRDDDMCLRWLRYPSPPDRRRRIEVFAGAYGLGSTDGLVDDVIAEQQRVLALTRRLAAEGREPQLTWLHDGVIDEGDRRVDWSRRHRHLLAGLP